MQFRKEWVVPATVGVLSFSAGVLVGYLYSQRRGTREVIKMVTVLKEDEEGSVLVEEEYEEPVEIVPPPRPVFPEEVFEQLEPEAREQIAIDQAISDERHVEELARIQEAQAKGAGKFLIADLNDWDFDVELPLRKPEYPYIITRQEFESQEGEGNSQSTLTYYAGDDVLCDEHDTPIYDYQRTVGVLAFGKGSDDISIVYVRNEKLGAEWEIIIDCGYFQTQVLGAEIEEQYEEQDLKHSIHKFRKDE